MGINKTIIVVGSAYGGLYAAITARRCDADARIIVVESAAQSSQQCGDEIDEEVFGRQHDVEVKKTRIVSLDPDARCLNVKAQGGLERLHYDSLIFAGIMVNRDTQNSLTKNSRVVDSFCLSSTLITKQKALKVKSAVVIGCGINGIKAALKLKHAGIDVVIVDKKKRVLPEYSLESSHAILAQLEREKIAVVLDHEIKTLEQESSSRVTIQGSHGKMLSADLVVTANGASVDVSPLASAGAALDVSGFLRVDDQMCTTIPQVFACGSAIKVPFVITNERKWLFCEQAWLASARVAGINACMTNGARESLRPFCQTTVLAIGGNSFGRTGLTDLEARAFLGDDNLLVCTLSWPSVLATSSVRIILDKNSHRIVGGEVFGADNVTGRISVLSVAVMEAWPVERLLDVDTAFLVADPLALDPFKEVALRAQFLLQNSSQVLSAETLALWLKNRSDFRLVDVGNSPLLSGRLVKNVVHLPLAALRTRAHELKSANTPIVLFSATGDVSEIAYRALMHQGVTDVYNLDGGLATFNLLFAKE